MNLESIHLLDKMMQPIGDLRVDRNNWLATCAICESSLRETDAQDQGEALMSLIRHRDLEHQS